MIRILFNKITILAGAVVALIAVPLVLAGDNARTTAEMPRNANVARFSEEREAAATQFVKKHVPELMPLLEKLKLADSTKYREEIGEIFLVSEFLNELQSEDAKRYELELEIWKTETRSLITVVKLASAGEEERAQLMDSLQESAKRLVELDTLILKLRVEQLEKELGDARDDLNKMEEKRDDLGKEKYEKLFDQAKRRRMMMQ